VTVASEFSPWFPTQYPNISYGLGQDVQVTPLVSNSGPAFIFVPTNGALGASWTAAGFDHAAWLKGTNGVGYELSVPGFAVRNIRANVGVCDLGTAESVLATPSQQAAVFTANPATLNYLNSGSGAHFGNDATFPGFTVGVDENNFVVEATGILTIPASGPWTFGVNSDDGFRVTLGAQEFSYPSPRGPGDTFATFNLAAGEHPFRLAFYECGGGSEVEFFAAAGAYTGFDAAFRLVGDTAGGGLAVKSLPVTGPDAVRSIRPLIATDVQAPMLGHTASAYLRLPFTLADPALFSTLTLRVKYTAGFIAYLNGAEVARRNAPASPQWNSAATASRSISNALSFEDVDLTSRLDLLQAGSNVLAFQGLSDSASADAFLILAELAENKVLGLTNHYFSTPTPGAVNDTTAFAFVENLKFTPGRGFFDSTNLSVTITSATPDVTIRFTLDGTAPGLTNGLLYAGPLLITNTTLLRATGYRAGFEPTAPETHTYLFLDQVQRQSTNDHYAGGSSGDYTLNTNITLGSAYRDTFRSDLLNQPTLSITLANEDFFGASGLWSNPGGQGSAWERPCSVEYLRPDGQKGFAVNCGLRIQGGVSRSGIAKHSLRLLFKSVYGPGKLAYPLYPDSPVQEFDTLTLHAGFNDHWLWVGAPAQLLRDLWCRDTQNALGGYGPHGTYAHLYINGLYWGLYNMGEHGDASYAAHYLGGDKIDYDAMSADQVQDGDGNAWAALIAIANAGLTNDLAYTNLAQYLDIPNFVDYLLMNFYAANTDWPSHNWKAARRRTPGAGFHFFSWDAEWVLGIGNDVNTDRTGVSAGDGSPGRLYAALRAHAEFCREFGDHAQKHLVNGGALTATACDARYARRAQEIDRAIVPETARWGGGYDRLAWLNEQNRLRTQWFPQRSAILLNQLRNAGLYPQLDAPGFSPLGGLVPPGYPLTLTNPSPAGTLYFTTDGTDPRRWGGAVGTTAQLCTGPLLLTNATFLRTRVRQGTNWSALVEVTFYVVQDFRPLVVTELMYNPARFGTLGSEDLEFLELKNTGTNTLDLSGLAFTDGITWAFTNGTQVAPGGFFLLARNPAALTARYPGVTVDGVYTGKLDNGGECITLAHLLGTNVFSFSYGTRPPWPMTPDGYGFSLVSTGSAQDPALASGWRPSAQLGGSPGGDDPPSDIPPVVINEILPQPSPPRPASIELHNPTAAPVNVGGWFLSDDPAQPGKFRIPDATVLEPGSFLVVTEADFNPQPGVPPSFALNALGGTLYLFSGDSAHNLTGYSHGVEFGVATGGVSFGRHLISTGEEQWPAQSAPTSGAANAGPSVGPVVINEIMYHPEPGYDEFLELRNVAGTNVALFDSAFPTNTWKLAGLGYSFPLGTVLPAGDFLLLVALDPDSFRAKYGVPAGVQILGPYGGALDNGGERLRLERPGTPLTDTNGATVVPYLVVDEVRFSPTFPWPVNADGQGPSLQRCAPMAYGNEPTNWFSSGITPGAENVFNLAPAVTLLSPPDGAVFAAPAAFTVAVQATDGDGVIAKVEFFRDGLKVGEAASGTCSLGVTNLAAGTYTFTIKARDNRQSTTSVSLTVTVTPPPVGTGTGLWAEYFDDLNFSGTRLARIDPTVNFDWGGGPPDPALGADMFSVRWTGQVQPRFSGRFTFFTRTDDGVRLWVDNQFLIDNWTDHGPTEDSGGLNLEAGRRYDLRMEYYENGGGAVATLSWAAADLPKEIIPATQLYANRQATILTQPQSLVARLAATVTFSVTADGTPPLAYQWFFSGEKLSGATADTLTLSNTQPAQAGSYWVVITNPDCSLTSQVATLVIATAPVYARQPQSQTVLVGDTVTFSVTVTGTPPLGYRWRKNGMTIVPYGAGTSTLTFTNVQLTNAGSYTAVVTNPISSGLASAAAILTVLVDSDADRMPDTWEAAHGLNANMNDASLDPDHDGMTNLEEYIAGTNPQDASSYLKVYSLTVSNTVRRLSFLALSNKTYAVQYRTALTPGPWQTLTNVMAGSTNRLEVITDPAALGSRFYRLMTPDGP
jgi:hypothetical protein